MKLPTYKSNSESAASLVEACCCLILMLLVAYSALSISASLSTLVSLNRCVETVRDFKSGSVALTSPEGITIDRSVLNQRLKAFLSALHDYGNEGQPAIHVRILQASGSVPKVLILSEQFKGAKELLQGERFEAFIGKNVPLYSRSQRSMLLLSVQACSSRAIWRSPTGGESGSHCLEGLSVLRSPGMM